MRKTTWTILLFLILSTISLLGNSIDNKKLSNLTEESNRYFSVIKSSENLSGKNKTIPFKKEGKYKVELSIEFNVDTNLDNFSSLNINTPEHIQDFKLNGTQINRPYGDMNYKTIPGIPISMLKTGKNILVASWTQRVISFEKAEEKRKKGRRIRSSTLVAPTILSNDSIKIGLIANKPINLSFQTGPVLGYAGQDFFTATCRVNIPAKVILITNGKEYRSEIDGNALLHSFKVENLKKNTEYEYFLKASISNNKNEKYEITTDHYTVKTLPISENFKFAMLGDSRSYPETWNKISEAVAKEKPILSVFAGDMVNNGKLDNQWDEEFFIPAKKYLSTIPFYAVIGNHERDCSLFNNMFKTPSKNVNWYQEVNQVLFIGIDGAAKKDDEKEKLLIWLENILSKSKAKFIFLTSHYPAWSSGYHGNLGYEERGEDITKPRERGARFARYFIMPLLKKYNVTAMFAGHDHCYERSEPENNEGVTMIITGGAGAPLYEKEENSIIQNPYSKIFEKKHHYCILTVNKEMCTMNVKTLEGVIIDQRVWKARLINK